MINFNIPPRTGDELMYIGQAIESGKISGDGEFTRKATEWLEQRFDAQKVLLTTSGTSALDMAALLCELQPGDEVILPSFTFSSTATAFALTGAKLIADDALLAAARREYDARIAKQPYICPIPEGIRPQY